MSSTRYILSLLLSVALSASAITHTWAPSSVLSDGTWVKIRVAESGVYRISDSELRNRGIDPANLRIYGYGGALLSTKFSERMIDDLCPVGYYRGDGYVLFYGQGTTAWTYNKSSQRFTHSRNTCSDYGYYFLTSGDKPSTLPTREAIVPGSSVDIVDSYTQLALHEVDRVNLVDPTGAAGAGKSWYGENMTADRNNLNITLPTHDLTGEDIVLVALMAASSKNSTKLSITHNEHTVNSTASPLPDIYTFATSRQLTLTSQPSSTGSQTVNVRAAVDASSTGYLDYIEANAPAYMRMAGAYLPIQIGKGLSSNTQHYRLTGANDRTQVWDITDLDSIAIVPATLSHDTLSWYGSNNQSIRRYIAVQTDKSGFLSPSFEGRVDAQNLHALRNIEIVIITAPEFLVQAEELATIHREEDGYSVAVVTTDQAYNEFSSGTPDVTAYRRLMKMLYDRSTDEGDLAPRWLLLFGDGSFDNRGLTSASGNHFVLTYQADNSLNEVYGYCADDYFGWLDNNTSSDEAGRYLRIGVGRLPVNTQDEATAVVAKIRAYYAPENAGFWTRQLLFLADDGDYGQHLKGIEKAAIPLMESASDYTLNKLYLSAQVQQSSSTGESYPAARRKMHNMMGDGVLTFDYCGHGSVNTLTGENMLTIGDVRTMECEHLALWTLATCSSGHWDRREYCLAEEAVLNPLGGAIGVFSACRTVYETQNESLNRELYAQLFAKDEYGVARPTIGEAIMAAKNSWTCIYETNKLAYNLLGDPAVRLLYPEDYVVEFTSVPDTIRALSTVTLKGRIADQGQTVRHFGGTVHITVYDKLQTIATIDNDEAQRYDTLRYQDYPNRLFSGQARVEDGEFELTFKIAKDIRYNYGNGRIVAYAQDSLNAAMAIGHDHRPIVGGAERDTTDDHEGPKMLICLNNYYFPRGGKTHDHPRFLARLSDPSGINTVGSAIGHDLYLCVDGKDSYILNDAYTADLGSFTSGTVSFALGTLEPGEHTLVFRAWDMLNNSSSDTLHFRVVRDLDPQIYALEGLGTLQSEIPTTVTIQHDRPDEVMTTTVTFFDLQGRRVASQQYSGTSNLIVQPTGMTPGLYIYRVTIETVNNQNKVTSGKIFCL